MVKVLLPKINAILLLVIIVITIQRQQTMIKICFFQNFYFYFKYKC